MLRVSVNDPAVQSVLAPFESGSETPGSWRKPPWPFHTTGSINPESWVWSKDNELPDILGTEMMSRHGEASWFTHLGPRPARTLLGAAYAVCGVRNIRQYSGGGPMPQFLRSTDLNMQ